MGVAVCAALHLRLNRPLSPRVLIMSMNFDARQAAVSTLTTISPTAQECARRHYQRALDRLKMRDTKLAVQELRDAIEADPYSSDYHALLAKIHLDKGLPGMANINLRQALKLNPEDALAQECLQKLQAQSTKSNKTERDLGTRLMNLLNRKL